MFIARHDLIYHNVDRYSYGVAVCDIDGENLWASPRERSPFPVQSLILINYADKLSDDE